MLITSRGPLVRTYLPTPSHLLFTYWFSVDLIDRGSGHFLPTRGAPVFVPLVLLSALIFAYQSSNISLQFNAESRPRDTVKLMLPKRSVVGFLVDGPQMYQFVH